MNRRTFLASAAATVAAPKGPAAAAARPGPLCFFSKHLPNMQPGPMARALKAVGYEGIELTVRAGGHVLPEKVETDLPKAVEAIRAEGLQVPIIACGFDSAEDKTARAVLATAAKVGVRFFRPAWFSYASADVRAELQRAGRSLSGLAAAAKRAGIELAYQNHSGKIGAPVWDLERLIAPLDPKWVGVDYDIRHAVAEGSAGSWKVGLDLVAARVKVFSVKDFYWERAAGGGFAMKDCALGQGMCDVKAPLEILAKQGFRGPVTVFLEYEPQGGKGEEATVAAAGRDLALLKTTIAAVYGPAPAPSK